LDPLLQKQKHIVIYNIICRKKMKEGMHDSLKEMETREDVEEF
jgi:hypothetical protein